MENNLKENNNQSQIQPSENKKLYKTKKNKNHGEKIDFSIAFMIIKRYLSYYKKSVIIAFLIGFIATAFNIITIIGLGDVQSFLTVLISQTKGSYEIISLTTFLTYTGLILVAYFLNSFTQWIMNFVVIRLAQGIGYRLRMDLFNKVQFLGIHFFDTHEGGDILSVLTNDVSNLVHFISQNLTQTLYGLITMVGMLILMFVISPTISLIVLVILIILLSFISIILRKSGPAFMQQQRQLGHLNGYTEEIISGQLIINLFSQQKNTINDFQTINKQLIKSAETSQGISGLLIPWLGFLINFIVAILYGIGVTFIWLEIPFFGAGASVTLLPDISNKIVQLQSLYASSLPNNFYVNLSLLTSMILATRNFLQPINQIIVATAQLQQAAAGCKRTNEIFEQKNEDIKYVVGNEIDFSGYNKPVNSLQILETVEINHPLKGKVEIKNLNFSYVKDKPVLKNVSISAEPGQTIAIVGPTGSGKTTIINLLTKFYDITDGDIFIDEYNIKQVTKESIRKQVSIVLQDTYLFSGTIKENIRLAKQDATDEEIYEAARTADCDDFIKKLPNGYDTILSENASELSSGQKQLIAIARAMISTSSILILDEATSNIDTRTERVVQNAMLKLIKNKTAFVIAHRLSTIKNADKIVVLKDGMVLETGNHKQLMKQKGFYYNLNLSKTDNLDEEKD